MNAKAQQLIDAAKKGDLAAVERILDSRPELANAEADGVPALMLAAYYGHPAVAGVIAARKERLSLFEAATVGDGEYLESALSADASAVNDYSSDGFTPLGFAAFFGHLDAAQALLAHGADPSLPSKNPLGVMPLHSALAGKHREIVDLLIEHGAPLDAPTAQGWNALHYAAHYGDEGLASLFQERGVRVERNAEGKSPADLAEEAGHSDMAARLRATEA